MGKDLKFANALTQAWMVQDHASARMLLLTLLGLLLSFVIWASQMELEVVTRGSGSVVPSDEIHVVDNLEGGILAELRVEEGARVRAGQMLLRIDNSSYLAALQQNQKMRASLDVTLQRLRAEVAGDRFQGEGAEQSVLENEQRLFEARRQQHQEKVRAYDQQIVDTELEMMENAVTIVRLQAEVKGEKLTFSHELRHRALEIVQWEKRFYDVRHKHRKGEAKRLGLLLKTLQREYRVNAQLEKAGAASEISLLKLRRHILETEGRLAKLQDDFVHQASMELKERREKQIALSKTLAGFKSARIDHHKQRLAEIAEALRQTQSERIVLTEKQRALQDKVDRSTVHAPMHGIVNKVAVKHQGAVIEPGQEIMEITPASKVLQVEVAIAPQDIAFIRPKQKAVVKVTAYDFAIYGGLDGEVDFISPDTHENDKGEAFYKVRIRTSRNHLGDNPDNVIMPGMHVGVDLIQGKRSLLHYILKPLRRMSEEALREL
ncbi:HlyD family efflux transporter periplasmic adaptor subunit [Magnetococcus sp. PR-3]|uniref:HlyD family efflux transporter periplasmic adaptor subunit n=1 Tax=Magnetococcus sp. PR-3 TaxID=3120355 RepID=UPI002FCDF57C